MVNYTTINYCNEWEHTLAPIRLFMRVLVHIIYVWIVLVNDEIMLLLQMWGLCSWQVLYSLVVYDTTYSTINYIHRRYKLSSEGWWYCNDEIV